MKDLLIIWTDVNDTGISIIDQQHRGIISAVNSLYFFMRHKQEKEMLASVIATIEQYTKIHFATEEKLLKAAEYPDFDAHKKLHDGLTRRSILVGNECKRNNDAYGYLMFLKDWWIDHINRHDRHYIEHLHNNSVINPATSAVTSD